MSELKNSDLDSRYISREEFDIAFNYLFNRILGTDIPFKVLSMMFVSSASSIEDAHIRIDNMILNLEMIKEKIKESDFVKERGYEGLFVSADSIIDILTDFRNKNVATDEDNL